MIIIKRDIGRPSKNHQDIKTIVSDNCMFYIQVLNSDYFSRYLISFIDKAGYHEQSYEYLEQSDLDKDDMKWLYNHQGNMNHLWKEYL
jgi:hypothetical protein